MAVAASAQEEGAAEDWTARQAAVLDAVLRLIVEGRALTMGSVASEASCSKETLYKWFGDRDGLLEATVRHQASRVRGAPLPPRGRLTRAALADSLSRFAADWLRVLGGETSLALNRLAIARASGGGADLGAIVLRNGPRAMIERLSPIIEAGRTAGLLAFDGGGEGPARVFFGLVVRDTQIRRLLGEAPPGDGEPEREADEATARFLTLFAAPPASSAAAPHTPT